MVFARLRDGRRCRLVRAGYADGQRGQRGVPGSDSVRTCRPTGPRAEPRGMRIELTGPPIVDLVRGTVSWVASSGCCDLCRRDADLYRLFSSPDALCRGCFAMWHG